MSNWDDAMEAAAELRVKAERAKQLVETKNGPRRRKVRRQSSLHERNTSGWRRQSVTISVPR